MSIEQFIVKNAYDHGFMRLLGKSLRYDRLWLDKLVHGDTASYVVVVSRELKQRSGSERMGAILYHLCLFDHLGESNTLNVLVDKSFPLELSVEKLTKVHNAYSAVQSL